MKKIFSIVMLFMLCCAAYAQQRKIDSLLKQTDKTLTFGQTFDVTIQLKQLPAGWQAVLKKNKNDIASAEKSGDNQALARALYIKSILAEFEQGAESSNLETDLQGLRIVSEAHDNLYTGRFLFMVGADYSFHLDYHRAIPYLLLALKPTAASHDTSFVLEELRDLVNQYALLKMGDSALVYARRELRTLRNYDTTKYREQIADAYAGFGEAFVRGNRRPDSALWYLLKARPVLGDDDWELVTDMADSYLKLGKRDSAIKYALKIYQPARKVPRWDFLVDLAGTLAAAYQDTDPKKSAFYLREQIQAADSLNDIEERKRFEAIAPKDKDYSRNMQEAQEQWNARLKLYIVVGAAGYLLVIGLMLWRGHNRQKNNNKLLNEQKEEISAQRDELQDKNQELGIESALERVRTVAMAMIKPDDLLSICETMFFELEKLGFDDLRNAMINIHYSEKKYLLNYEFRETVGKTVVKVIYNSHPIVNKLVNHAQQPGEGFTEQVYTGETLEEWKAFRKGNGEADDPRLDNISALYYYFYSIGTGSVGVSMFSVANAWQLDVLKRFRNVFDLAYKRYVDITNAEAQAREAQIQLGLERVRARAMAMQQSEELSELVSVLIAELSKLDMALSWCLVTLLDEASWSARVWRANSQQDQAPQMYYLPFADHPFQIAIMQAWKERKEKWSYMLTGDEKTAMDDYMFTKTDYSKLPQQVQAGIRAADPAYFYFSFGNFGGLQVGGPKQLSEDSLNILARFGKVFDLTYTRFNDLKIAEANAMRAAEDLVKLQQEKKRTEDALTDLRAAQKQLVQSEKMASLGELTAGIAHEIQNPLNFVNNFSEVNEEMLEELKAESEKPKAERDEELEIALINDLIDNQRKIKHHGKRADSIVKGMLEHSRASTGEKQLTDLNVLCDEFMKLSHHGLRAKDKNFNAVPIAMGMETHFDGLPPKANVSQQDIGRVMLNLFNNAFYAVNQKLKTAGPDYKPIVAVSTIAKGDAVEITVKDNGNGIPDAIKDKIMQPFFTTKPTGEGTGLGLSLSYDIVVKGHGGSISVDTKEGEFTEITITLPVKA